jgi:hypothetical protein
MIESALSLTTVLLIIIVLTVSLITLWNGIPIAHWVVYTVLGFLGAFSVTLLIKEFFFSDPYATWPALIGVIGLSVTLTLSTTLPMFFHLNSRIDQLYQQHKK